MDITVYKWSVISRQDVWERRLPIVIVANNASKLFPAIYFLLISIVSVLLCAIERSI